MSNRRVMFECHKQIGLMHSLGCSGAEGPHNIIFAPVCAKLESNWGGGDKRQVSPANDSVATARVICDPAAQKIYSFGGFLLQYSVPKNKFKPEIYSNNLAYNLEACQAGPKLAIKRNIYFKYMIYNSPGI